MAQEMIKKIQAAEAEALARQQAAKEQGVAMIAAAREQAEQNRSKAFVEAKEKQQDILRRVTEESEQVKNTAAQTANEQCVVLREKAEKQRSQTIRLVTEQLLG